jgi:GT2 family glycosyltransferase
VKKTIVVIPHYGPDQLLIDLLRSAGFAVAPDVLSGEAALIELPAYAFLIVNNNLRNRGFTAACNTGLQWLKNAPPDFGFAWLLNNDTVFESRMHFEDALAGMQTLSDSRNWGIVSQQVRSFTHNDAILFGGGLECYPSGRHRSGFVSRHDWAVPSEEIWVTFCSVLIRRDVVDKIGVMDEAMVTYFSDSDYCLSARRAGMAIGYAGEASYLFHKAGQSATPGEAQQQVLREDYLSFWRKWIGGDRNSAYLALTSRPDDGRSWRAGDLQAGTAAFPEMRSWLRTLQADQKISLRDILEHFQHKTPATEFTVLCNIAEELLPR